MARGFESKSVEAQQLAAETRRHYGPPMSMADAERREKRRTLELARANAEANLQTASATAHRAMLQQSIAELDRRIAELE